MTHLHTEKVETIDAEGFRKWDLVGGYNDAKEIYPVFTEGDQGRLRAVDWAVTELQHLQKSGLGEESVSKPYCIDIGCAHGQPVVQTFAEQGFEVVGVDLSDGLLDQAKKNLAHLTNAHFELADMRTWEPPSNHRDGNVDCVTTFYVLGHIPLADYEAVVAKMARWLKPKGVMVLATVAHLHGWVTTRMSTFASTSLNIEDNVALLEKNGCEIVKAWEEEWSSTTIAVEDSRTHQFIYARKK